MREVCERAYAKINLYLDLTGKRPDGYHTLLTVMRTVTLADDLRAARVDGDEIVLDCGVGPRGAENLAVRAAQVYFRASGARFGVRLTLEKRIPMAAGLGGGSADAAAVLRALNRLDGGRFTPDELCRIGAGIGADVPFCVRGGTALCRGIGDILEPLRTPTDTAAVYVVAAAGEGVSTPAAFRALDERYPCFDGDAVERRARAFAEADAADPPFFNRFEEVIEPLRPAVAALKAALRVSGARAAMMSGSGPAVWGLFDGEETAESAAARLRDTGAFAEVCRSAPAAP